MRRLLLGVMLATTLLIGRRACAHETDQFTVPPDRQFADLGDFFNRWAYEAIAGGVRVANDRVCRAVEQHQPQTVIDQLKLPSQVTMSVRSQWPWSVTSIETFETVLASPQMRQKYPGKLVAFGDRFNGAYLTAFGPLDVRGLAHLLFFSSTIKVYGTYVGTDKFGHFTDEGISYYFAYKDARDAGASERQAIARAVLLGTDGLMSERGALGLLANGDYANGDLAGNFAGFLFYRNLTEPVVLKGVLRPPMLLRDGPFWRLADHVRPDSGFFAWFISDHLDEALNPGYFDPQVRPGLADGVRRQSARILRHYCDEQGRPRSREWFDRKLAELSTYWGMDYGHLGRYDELVSIGRCCFGAGNNAPAVPTLPSDAELASAVFRGPPAGEARSPAVHPRVNDASTDLTEFAGASSRVARAQRPQTLGALYPTGVDLDHRDEFGRTPLQEAARAGKEQAVQLLLERGARADLADDYGTTPLHLACRRGSLPVARLLLDHRAPVNASSASGATPLHEAALFGDEGLVKLLLEHGARRGARDARGRTPADVARLHGFDRLAAILQPSLAGAGR